jgi:hypothetical protein
MPIIPTMQEAEVEGFCPKASKKHKILPEKQSKKELK